MNNNDPLHGIKLIEILEMLIEHYGYEELGKKININCFNSNPNLKSCLKFLRDTKHEWARIKVENLYIDTFF